MKKQKQVNSNNGRLKMIALLAVGIFIVFIFVNFLTKGNDVGENIVVGQDLIIAKGEITGTAKFYPYPLALH